MNANMQLAIAIYNYSYIQLQLYSYIQIAITKQRYCNSWVKCMQCYSDIAIASSPAMNQDTFTDVSCCHQHINNIQLEKIKLYVHFSNTMVYNYRHFIYHISNIIIYSQLASYIGDQIVHLYNQHSHYSIQLAITYEQMHVALQ